MDKSNKSLGNPTDAGMLSECVKRLHDYLSDNSIINTKLKSNELNACADV